MMFPRGMPPKRISSSPLIPVFTRSRLPGLVIVLTLQMRRKEGHPAYRSQSEPPPGRGTTLGGSTDDPRRQRTRTAAARDTTRAGGGQRQRGVPRAGDLAHSVLPLAATLGALWCGRGASAPAERRAWSSDSGGPGSRARGAGAGDQYGDLGLRAARGLSHAPLADSPGAEYGAARPAPRGLGHAARSADDPRASRGAHRRAVDRPDSPTALAGAPREHAPRRGHGARRAG